MLTYKSNLTIEIQRVYFCSCGKVVQILPKNVVISKNHFNFMDLVYGNCILFTYYSFMIIYVEF